MCKAKCFFHFKYLAWQTNNVFSNSYSIIAMWSRGLKILMAGMNSTQINRFPFIVFSFFSKKKNANGLLLNFCHRFWVLRCIHYLLKVEKYSTLLNKESNESFLKIYQWQVKEVILLTSVSYVFIYIFYNAQNSVFYITCVHKILFFFSTSFISGSFPNLGELKFNLSLRGRNRICNRKVARYLCVDGNEGLVHYCHWCGYIYLLILGIEESQIYSCFTN